MGVTAKPRGAVVLLMVLTLGTSLGLPAEDVLDIVYDESEPAPCEVIPLVSTASPLVPASGTQVPPRPLRRKPVVRSLFPAAQIRNTHAPRSTDTRALSELLCVLIC
jgi:hypothetical protein